MVMVESQNRKVESHTHQQRAHILRLNTITLNRYLYCKFCFFFCIQFGKLELEQPQHEGITLDNTNLYNPISGHWHATVSIGVC